MREKNIRYINDFLNNPEIFFQSLSDDGIFNKEEFQNYTSVVYELSVTDLIQVEKYKVAILIWEISYRIQSVLGRHVDPEDFVCIDNLDDDDIRQISNILLYSANWFSYDKSMDKNSLMIGSWS
jgi:hypothetical protein